jgi:hypothetical protein
MPLASYCVKHPKIALLILLVFISFKSYPQNLPLPNAYAHNDYWHKRPLYDALDNGFTHIEVDVYLRNGEMIVAHILPILNKHRTLEKLYLNPLQSCISGTNSKTACPEYPIMLMIDIKSEGNATYRALEIIFNKYRPILSTYDNGLFIQRQITIVITGHKPVELIKQEIKRTAFIDEDLMKVKRDTVNTNLYKTASCRYAKIISWEGKGIFPDKQRQNLCIYVAQAHKLGEKVRLWASPEDPIVWDELLKCGVDLINTDKLAELRTFLTKRQELTLLLK